MIKDYSKSDVGRFLETQCRIDHSDRWHSVAFANLLISSNITGFNRG